MRTLPVLAGLVGAALLGLSLPGSAIATIIGSLPQNADGVEQSFSPAYDYDGDGCYATAAINAQGELNPGLKIAGAVNGSCHDPAQLQNSNTYSRALCKNNACAVMYGSYFEKDQTVDGAGGHGHTHDWEHVIAWVLNNQVQYVSVSVHDGYQTFPRDKVQFDNGHPKVVYHKDGGGTHCFRIANSGEQPENYTHGWFYPRLVGWNGYPSGLRDKLLSAKWGQPTLKINDYDFGWNLQHNEPSGFPLEIKL